MTVRRMRNVFRLFARLLVESADVRYAWRLALMLTKGL